MLWPVGHAGLSTRTFPSFSPHGGGCGSELDPDIDPSKGKAFFSLVMFAPSRCVAMVFEAVIGLASSEKG
jgi:hypothetical protein